MTTEETSAEEERLDRYCGDIVAALRDELRELDGDVDHGLWYPEPGESGEARMTFEVMYTNPETAVTYFAWTPSQGWVYYLDDQSPDEAGHRMDVRSDDNPQYVAYVAGMFVEAHARAPYPVPQIRELLNSYSDEHPAVRAVHNVMKLHKPELVIRRGQWQCAGCIGGDECPSPYPCPTVKALIRSFDLDSI